MKALPFRDWSLSVKLPLTLVAMVVTVALTIGAVLVVQERDRIRGDLEARAMLVARSIASSLSEPVLRSDYWMAFKLLDQITADSGSATDGMVLDAEGRVVAHLRPDANPVGLVYAGGDATERQRLREALNANRPALTWIDEDSAVEAILPITAAGNAQVGLIVLRLAADELAMRTLWASLTILGIAIGLAIVGSSAGAYISNRMVMPLRQLSEAMAVVAKGESTPLPQVRIRDRDEIGGLIQAFHRMAADLAEKRTLEKELATAEKLAALGRIAAGVAHEVNNPLAGMLNCIDTIERYPNDHRLAERYLPLIKNGLNRIHGIVRALLVELRHDDRAPTPVGDCLNDLHILLASEIEGRNINFVWQNALDSNNCVQCRRVYQAVLNLLKNAVQAVSDGGTVILRAHAAPSGLVIEVEDDGIGISADDLGHLFDPFFSTKPNGTGLGLWITFRLVQSMGGSIEVESSPGAGSLFRIRL